MYKVLSSNWLKGKSLKAALPCLKRKSIVSIGMNNSLAMVLFPNSQYHSNLFLHENNKDFRRNSKSPMNHQQNQKGKYSNILVSTLFQVSTQDDRDKIIEVIKKELFSKEEFTLDSLNTVLKCMDCLESADFYDILEEFIKSNTLLSSMKHRNSHKVLLRLYDGLSEEKKPILLQKCIYEQNVFDICTGKYSSATVKQLVTKMSFQERDNFISHLPNNQLIEISKDHFGAFLVSKLVELGNGKEILRILQPHYAEMMIHPSGNYVIQKCIEKMNENEQFKFVNLLKNDFKYLIVTSQGSIVTRHLLARGSEKLLSHFFSNIALPNIRVFASNKYSNFCLEILYENISNDQRKTLVKKVAEDILQIAHTTSGSLFVQKLFENFTSDHLDYFSNKIIPHIKTLAMESSSSFVIQALFEKANKTTKKEILSALKPYITEMFLDKNGSRLLQSIVRCSERSDTDSIALSLFSNFEQMAQNETSAPLFQLLASKGYSEPIFLRIKGKVEQYSQQNLGSYIVSACIKDCKKTTLDQLLMELLVDSEGKTISEEKVQNLLKYKSCSFVLLDAFNALSQKYSTQAIYHSFLSIMKKNNHLCKNKVLFAKIEEANLPTIEQE